MSLEQLNVLDADVMMLSYHSEEFSGSLEDNPLFQQLLAVQRGDYIHIANDVSTGIAYPSVLSIPYVLDWITPRLTQALNAQ
ncbi:MAG: hypothetical protein ACRDTG_10725 [Pseudonocardiaceae bacterium]